MTANTGDVYSLSIQNPEENNIYLKLSNLTKNIGNDIVESMRSIEEGDDKTALKILSNVTLKIEEIYNGLEILENDISIRYSD
ncbi:MAG TPA: hypothetical protein VJ583_07485 [Nitrososphaeraceae archaeon]|nr:hypothetical protein [Nitrososphaeraceae archaeon]